MEDQKRSAVADNDLDNSVNTNKETAAENAFDATVEDGSPLAAITLERDQLALQRADLQDRYLRLQAEFDNFRRRADRERLEFAEYAGMETARELLPIVDDFERALKASSAASAGGDLMKGVELIYSRLLETLKKLGVEAIQSETEFDPHVHHAVQKEQSSDLPDGTILEVYQRGYNFKGKLLRPAMVKVAVKA